MLEEQLEKFGLHKNQTRVYLALLELGKSKAGTLIEHTKLHRNLVYTALEELAERGLVTKILRGAVAEFSANDPRHLVDELEAKKQMAEKVVAEIRKKASQTPREVTVYEGNESIIDVTEKNLNAPSGEMFYILGASNKTIGEPFGGWNKFHKMRAKKNIPFRALYDRTVDENILREKNKLPLAEAKYFPFDIEMPVWFNMCNDKLAIMVTGEDPLVFDIRSRPVADAMKKYFEYFWNQQVSVDTGIEALERAVYNMLNELKQGEEYSVLGAASGDPSKDIQILYDKFHTDRIKKGIITKMLVYRESFKRIKNRFEACGDPDGKLSFLKIYASAPKIPMQINTYHGKAFIILYADKPTVIQFEGPDVYEGFKAYFDSLWSQEAVLETGMDALRRVFFDMLDELKPGDEYYVLGTALGADPKYLKFFKDYHTQRIKKGVTVKMLAYRDQLLSIKNKLFEQCGDPHGKVSIIKPFTDAPTIPMQITLFKNKMRLLFSGKEPVVMYFDRPEAHQGFKKYFDFLWGQDTYVVRGPQELYNIWMEAIETGGIKFIGARGQFIDRYPHLIKKIEERMKNTKNVYWKNILDPSMIGHRLAKYPWSQNKYVLTSTKNFNVVWLYNNKVAVVNWAENEPIVLVSENKILVQSYNDYFEELWRQNPVASNKQTDYNKEANF